MQIIAAIVLSILLGYFWIWLVQHVFLKKRKTFSLSLLATSIFLVGSLYLFSYIIGYFFPNFDQAVFSLSWFGYFLLYCALIFLFLIFVNANYKSKHMWFLFIVWMVLFALVGFFGFKMGIQAVLIYYFVSAYAEEFLKIGASENATNKTDFYSSDILSFSLLLALGFSIVENLFYIGQEIFSPETTPLFSLVFGRGIFSSLVHLVSTGLIALLLYKLYQKVSLQQISSFKKIIRVIFCLLMGVVLHLLYNYLLNFSQFWVYLVVVIGGYYLLSYILFLSDNLYRSEESKSKKV